MIFGGYKGIFDLPYVQRLTGLSGHNPIVSRETAVLVMNCSSTLKKESLMSILVLTYESSYQEPSCSIWGNNVSLYKY